MRKALARRITGVVIGNDGRVTTNNGCGKGLHTPEYVPTQREIKKMTKLIQATWDEEQRNSRRVLKISDHYDDKPEECDD